MRRIFVGLVLALFASSLALADEPCSLSIAPAAGITNGKAAPGIDIAWDFGNGITLGTLTSWTQGQTVSGVATGMYDYDLAHRWPVVPVSLPYEAKTKDGISFTLAVRFRVYTMKPKPK